MLLIRGRTFSEERIPPREPLPFAFLESGLRELDRFDGLEQVFFLRSTSQPNNPCFMTPERLSHPFDTGTAIRTGQSRSVRLPPQLR